MSLTRRGALAAAAGAAVAGPQVLQRVGSDSSSMPMAAYANAPAEDPAYAIRRRSNLLEEKSNLERWARGEFTDDEMSPDDDPRYSRFPVAEQGVASLKSVSAGHKVLMCEQIARKRYAGFRQKNAAQHLAKILQELAKL